MGPTIPGIPLAIECAASESLPFEFVFLDSFCEVPQKRSYSEDCVCLARTLNPTTNLCECGFARGGDVVGEGGKAAVVGGAQGLDRNNRGGFEDTIANLFGGFDGG